MQFNTLTCFLSALQLFALFGVESAAAAQPTYQVSIYLSVHPRAPLVHMCNGAILQRRIILTTASCMQLDTLATQGPTTSNNHTNTVSADRLRVVAGQTGMIDYTGVFPVDAVHVLSSFDPTTLDDDLAVLRLKHPLPLGLRDDMKWIVPDDNEQRENGGCVANFYARNVLDAIPDSQQEEKVQPLPPQSCGIVLPTHSHDFCGHYLLPQHFECEQYEEFKRFNADRGTGLVCSSRLVALLSQTLQLPASAEWHCSERPVPAMYTALAPHNDWIYQFIAIEEYEDMASNNYVPSLPYSESDPKVTSKPISAGIASTTHVDPAIGDSTPTVTTTTATIITNITTTVAATTNTHAGNDDSGENRPISESATVRPISPTFLPGSGRSTATSFRYAHTLSMATAATAATMICHFVLMLLL